MVTRLKTTIVVAVMLIPTTAFLTCTFVMPVTLLMSILAAYSMDYHVIIDILCTALPVTICSITLLVSFIVATAVSHN